MFFMLMRCVRFSVRMWRRPFAPRQPECIPSDARAAKDWTESDKVRDELNALGVRIKDGPQGTTWERAV